MTTLFYHEPELVIGLNRTIIFVNPNDHQIFKSVEIPEKLESSVNGKQEEEETPQTEGENKSATSANEPLKIQQVAYSPNRQLLAITTSGQKNLLLYKCRPEHAWRPDDYPIRSLARASSAITFSSDSDAVLVTDKTGDCYLYDCKNLEAPGSMLFGHLSIVYDVIWSADKKRIITCDRDDKIRVTNFPETHDIHGYCLGHKEFVSGIKPLSGSIIASISGDKTLRLWCYESCKELFKVELPGAATKFDVRPINEFIYQVAILHQLDDCISRYELTYEANKWHCMELEIHSLKGFTACNLCFADGRLYVVGVVDNKFTLKVLPISDALPPKEKWTDMVESEFQQYSWSPEDVACWFKKRYDNVNDYLERKKRRIEEKQK